jgi:ribosomal protein S18 acetylase RimI-like enzyme
MTSEKQPNIVFQLEPSSVRDKVFAELTRFNSTYCQHAPSPMIVAARDPDGNIIGGIVGRSIADWMHLEMLWVDGQHRGLGIGASLMAQAEAEARRRACVGVHFDTFSFQAPDLYPRLGYEQFAVIEDHPLGHRRVFFAKRFAP